MAIKRVARGDLQVIDPASVLLRGYAAVFGNVFKQENFWSTHRYRVMPGAFKGVLERMNGEPLPGFFSHLYHDRPQIAETTVLREDSRGLYFEAQTFATAEALDVLTVIDGRASKRIGASFSFDFGEIIETDDGIEEIFSFTEIHELGPTTWGANPLAYAEIVPREAAAEDTEPAEEAAAPVEAAAAAGDITSAAVAALSLDAAAWRATAQLRSIRNAR